MKEPFAQLLLIGGKSNSLGKVDEVIELVLNDKSRLDELYDCLFNEDAWARMRAADALEKICRQHPDWLLPYIDKLSDKLTLSTQPSIQWHLAQIYRQVTLTDKQRKFVLRWLKQLLSTKELDWIVAANTMDTLAHFTRAGFFPVADFIPLLTVQQKHKSNAVVKRANKLLTEFSAR